MAGFTYSTSTPNAQLSEEQRRQRYRERMLREAGGKVDALTQQEIDNKAKTIPISQVDQELGYTPDESQYSRTESLNAGQAGVEQAQSQLGAKQAAGVDPNDPSPIQTQIFNLLDKSQRGEITPQQYAEQFQALTGISVPGGNKEENQLREAQQQKRQMEKEHAAELKRRYGREVSQDYVKAIEKARESGLYTDDFKDNLFGAGAFNGAKARSRRGWTKEDYAREYSMLNKNVDQFERVRQQLTENFQRLDPFARTQYNEMSKQIQGLERASSNGQIRPIEYLRAMNQLADRSQQIKWKYHMRQPGQSPGEISEQNGMIMQMTNEGPQMMGITPDYIKKNTYVNEAGQIMEPEWDGKAIKHVAREDANNNRIPDYKERAEMAKDFEQRVDEQYDKQAKAWAELNPGEEPTSEDYARFRELAKRHVSNQMSDNMLYVEGMFDPAAKQQIAQREAQEDQMDAQQKQQAQQEAQERGLQEGSAQVQQQREQLVQAAAEQLMEKNKDLDENKALQIAKDDMYAMEHAKPIDVLKRRNQYDADQKRAERGIGPEQQLAYQTLMKKAKNADEKAKIRSENWERDPVLARAADNPIVYQPGMKRRAGEVYMMRRGDEYIRVWHLGSGKNIILRTPEEKLQERLDRIEKDESRVKKSKTKKAMDDAYRQYGGRF